MQINFMDPISALLADIILFYVLFYFFLSKKQKKRILRLFSDFYKLGAVVENGRMLRIM